MLKLAPVLQREHLLGIKLRPSLFSSDKKVNKFSIFYEFYSESFEVYALFYG